MKQRNTDRRISMVGLLILAAVLLSACGWTGTGTVESRSHRSSHTTTTTSCHLVGKVNVCNPKTTQHPDKWTLRIKDSEGNNHTVTVSEKVYDSTKIGSKFSNEK